MSNIPLPIAHLRRIQSLLSELAETTPDGLGARARNAAEWLQSEIEAHAEPSGDLRDKINSLRREWAEFPKFSALEENFFRVNEDGFRRVPDAEWDLIREYLAYQPREREKFFQVELRNQFIKSPKETFGAARAWGKTHRKTPVIKKVEERGVNGAAYPSDEETKEILRSILDSLKD